MKLSELKAKAAQQLLDYHATMKLVADKRTQLLKDKQAKCPHPAESLKLKSEGGYYEAGRMSGPTDTTYYKVCGLCKKRLFTQLTETTTKFVPITE